MQVQALRSPRAGAEPRLRALPPFPPFPHTQTHLGPPCASAAGNRYHQLTYDVPLAEGLLGSMSCEPTSAVPLNLLDKLIQAPRADASSA